MLGVHKRLLHQYPRVVHHVLCRGRAHSVSCIPADSHDGLPLVNVHIEPDSTIATRRGIIGGIIPEVDMRSRSVPFIFGDRNFVDDSKRSASTSR